MRRFRLPRYFPNEILIEIGKILPNKQKRDFEHIGTTFSERNISSFGGVEISSTITDTLAVESGVERIMSKLSGSGARF